MKIESNVPPWATASILTIAVAICCIVVVFIWLALEIALGKTAGALMMCLATAAIVWFSFYMTAKKGSYEKG